VTNLALTGWGCYNFASHYNKLAFFFLFKPVFSHGQLYIAFSRVTSKNDLKVFILNEPHSNHFHTKNIVYKEIFNNLPRRKI
jgi:hypothetical protein